MPDHQLLAQLKALGHPDAQQIAVGMQGAVFRLGGEKIAKIWFHASTAELERLDRFYSALACVELSFRTPEIQQIHQGRGWHVTVETELPGAPLHTVAPEFGTPGWPAARDCILDVLGELSTVAASPELNDLGVLNEQTPFRRAGLTWTEALEGLVLRRVEKFGDQLRPVIDDFDGKLANLLQVLRETKQADARLVHGDVTAGNIMVDEHLRPVSVLDFGLLSMPGDPAYDAASAGTMFSVWSAELRAIEADFDAALVARFGYQQRLLLMYRAVHLLLISNAHDEDPYERDAAVPLAAEFFNSNQFGELV